MKRNYANPRASAQYRALSDDLSGLPFSFVYDGKKYTGFSTEYFTCIGKETIQSGDKETRTIQFAFLETLWVLAIMSISTVPTAWICKTISQSFLPIRAARLISISRTLIWNTATAA